MSGRKHCVSVIRSFTSRKLCVTWDNIDQSESEEEEDKATQLRKNLRHGGVTHMLAGRNSNGYLGGRLASTSLLEEGRRADWAALGLPGGDGQKRSSAAALLPSKSSL